MLKKLFRRYVSDNEQRIKDEADNIQPIQKYERFKWVTTIDEEGNQHQEPVITDEDEEIVGKVQDYKLQNMLRLGINLNELYVMPNESVIEKAEGWAKKIIERYDKLKELGKIKHEEIKNVEQPKTE